MKYRLSEGSGECFYYVGVEDGGYPRGLEPNDLRLSLNNLNYMAKSLKATATIAKLLHGAHGRAYALAHVRRNCVEKVHYVELRVAGVPLASRFPSFFSLAYLQKIYFESPMEGRCRCR
jgi:GTPase